MDAQEIKAQLDSKQSEIREIHARLKVLNEERAALYDQYAALTATTPGDTVRVASDFPLYGGLTGVVISGARYSSLAARVSFGDGAEMEKEIAWRFLERVESVPTGNPPTLSE
jgi:hypothetical protein